MLIATIVLIDGKASLSFKSIEAAKWSHVKPKPFHWGLLHLLLLPYGLYSNHTCWAQWLCKPFYLLIKHLTTGSS